MSAARPNTALHSLQRLGRWVMLAFWALAALLLLGSPAHAGRQEASDGLTLGTKQFMLGEYAKARTTLNAAIKQDPKWATPYAMYSMALLELGDGLGAEAQLDRAKALGQPLNTINHLRAMALFMQGRDPEALALADPAKVLPKYRGYSSRVRALVFARMGRIDDAGGTFDEAITLDPAVRGLWGDVASFRYQRGDVSGAIDAAVVEAKQAPRSQRAMMIMGDLIRGRYGLKAALPWFRRAVQIEPGNVDALGELAATLGDVGRYSEMLAATRKMIAINPNNPRPFYLQAVMAARAGKFDLARALLYRTQGQMEDVPAVLLLSAGLELQAGSAESAISQLQKLITAQPDNLTAKALLGSAFLLAGDPASAVQTLDPLVERKDADSYVLAVFGRAMEENDQLAEAAPYLDRAQKSKPADAEPFDLSYDLLRQARASAGPSDRANEAVPYINKMLLEGDPAAGVLHAQRMAKLNPGSPGAQMLEGDALVAAGHVRHAILPYKRSADLRFTAPIALRMIDALRETGDHQSARQVLDYFLNQNPQSIPGLQLAAEEFMAAGAWDKAIRVLESLRARLGERDATVMSHLGWAWHGKRNADKAIRYTARGYELAPGNAEFAAAYGWVLVKTGRDKAGGLALLRKADRIEPNHADHSYRLGVALHEAGKAAEARRFLAVAAANEDYANADRAAALLAKP